MSREVAGRILLVASLFFGAAFVSGRGAFLGEAGLVAARHLMGVLGYALAPVAVVAGLLLVVGRLAGRGVLGGGWYC